MLDELVAFYGAEYEDNGGQRIDYTYGGNEGSIYIKNTDSNLPVGTLQKFLDKYLAENGGKIDYIHGNDVVRNLGRQIIQSVLWSIQWRKTTCSQQL